MVNEVNAFDAEIIQNIMEIAKREAIENPHFSDLEPLLDIAEQQSFLINRHNEINGTDFVNIYDLIKEAVDGFPLPTNKITGEGEINKYLLETGKKLAKIELPEISIATSQTPEP